MLGFSPGEGGGVGGGEGLYKVQSRMALYAILTEKKPLLYMHVYLLLRKGTPFTYLLKNTASLILKLLQLA